MRAEDVIKDADPDDGLNVVEVNLGGNADVSLHVAFRREGELVPLVDVLGVTPTAKDSICFWEYSSPNSRSLGALARIKGLVQALCRFLNTGGTFAEMKDMHDTLEELFCAGSHDRPILKIPGFHLLTTGINDEGEHEHLFAADDGGFEGIRWVEGRFIESVDLSDMLEEGEVDSASTAKIELLPEPGPGAAEEVEGTPEV